MGDTPLKRSPSPLASIQRGGFFYGIIALDECTIEFPGVVVDTTGMETKREDSPMSTANDIVDELTVRCVAFNVLRAGPKTDLEADNLVSRYCLIFGKPGRMHAEIMNAYHAMLPRKEVEDVDSANHTFVPTNDPKRPETCVRCWRPATEHMDILDGATGQGRR